MAAIFKLIAVFSFLVASVFESQAASMPLSPSQRSGVAQSANGWISSWNATAAASNNTVLGSQVTGSLAGWIKGRQVDIPAVWGLAATGAEAALSILGRGGVIGLLGAGAVGWLASYGLSYIEGKLKKEQAPDWIPRPGKFRHTWSLSAGPFATPELACADFGTHVAYTPITRWNVAGFENGCYQAQTAGSLRTGLRNEGYQDCPAEYSLDPDGMGCSRPGVSRPATEEDLAAAKAAPLPDAVADDLRKAGVPLPLDKPQVNTTPQDIPISDPYRDPLTGKRYRDFARVTPQSDGQTAKVEITKQEVDANGDPVVDSDTGQAKSPEEQKDVCEKNPDASMCKGFDDVEDSELKNREINLSINPLSGFGATSAQCPATQTLFSKGGQQITWDWSKFCTFSQGIRPLVLGFAWLAAIMIVVGVVRKEA